MKLIKNIYKTARMIVIPCCMLTACNYLDVIPPAQADFEDTMKDQNAVENFLFTCYGYVPRCQYNPQIQISAESETKRSIFRIRD